MLDTLSEVDVSWIGDLIVTLMNGLIVDPLVIVYNMIPIIGNNPVSMEFFIMILSFTGFSIFYRKKIKTFLK